MRLALVLLLAAALLYLLACAALYVFQRSLVFFPQPRSVDTPVIRVVDIAGDTPVLATVRTLPGPKAVVYLGGNGEDVTMGLPQLAEAFPDRALYLLHYRGFGGSGGRPTEEAIAADALALFDRVHAEHPDVVVIGRSLGSGVATRLASQRPASRLVLVTPYHSLEEIAAGQYRWFPVRWLLKDKFESWRYVPQVRAPALLIAAENDEVIPLASTERLFARFGAGAAQMSVVPGTSHNSISAHPMYVLLLRGAR